MDLLNKILEKDFQKSKKIEKYDITLFNRKYTQNLLKLYEKVFPDYMTEKLWEWKNIKNPFGNYLTITMKHKDKLIASYSVSPKEFLINGEKINCVQSMDTMTDKNYRGLGISTYLANLTYEYAKLKGYAFVYGFPNDISKYLFEVKLKWNKVIKTSYLIKELNQKQVPSKKRSNFKIEKLKEFDNRINKFWNSYDKDGKIIINKNREYLNWRFKEHPLINYEIFYVENAKNELVSYFVLKRYKDKDDNELGHIVDFIIKSNNGKSKIDIFKAIDEFATNKFLGKCKSLSLWIPDTLLQQYAKNKLGYNVVKEEPYFGFKILKDNKQLKILNSMKNWYITMSNEDIF